MTTKLIAGFILTSVIIINLAFKKYTTLDTYQPAENKNYRIYAGDSYQILDTAAFYLYYRYVSEENVKGKSFVKAVKYFFSKNAGSPIMGLTTENLEKAFPDNLPFHYAIESLFRTSQDLIGYDVYCSCYKITYLYKQSLK